MTEFSRRRFTAVAAGIGTGLFATSRLTVGAQDEMSTADASRKGVISTRVRTVESAEQRDAANERTLNGFVRDVQALDGFEGYLLADVTDEPEKSLSIAVFDNESQMAAFRDLATDFTAEIEKEVSITDTVEWSGDLLVAASGRQTGAGAPPASPGAGPLTRGQIAVRVYKSLPESDPGELVPRISTEFLPMIDGLEGFRGYLWYVTEDGFVSISVFDSEGSARESSEAATAWAAESLSGYTEDPPEVIDANARLVILPVLRKA